MSSPNSLLFADIVMDDLETTCLKLLKEKSDCIPLFYWGGPKFRRSTLKLKSTLDVLHSDISY